MRGVIMNKNKVLMFFCDYSVMHSIAGKQLGLDRKGEIKTFINSLEKLRINENANQVLLTFISDNEEFKGDIKNVIKEIRNITDESNIVFGNHFDHKFGYSCDGISSNNTENSLPSNPNTIIGDKLIQMIRNLISNTDEQHQNIYNNQITSVRIARNNIGETVELNNMLASHSIPMVHYTFDPFTTNLPSNSVITHSKNMIHANWTDLTAINAILNNELSMIKKEQQKQEVMVLKK
jgi:hypothetical protein